MNIQMELRKCCNHPFMVRGVEDHEVDQIVSNLVSEAQKGVRSFLSCLNVALPYLSLSLIRSLVLCWQSQILSELLIKRLQDRGTLRWLSKAKSSDSLAAFLLCGVTKLLPFDAVLLWYSQTDEKATAAGAAAAAALLFFFMGELQAVAQVISSVYSNVLGFCSV